MTLSTRAYISLLIGIGLIMGPGCAWVSHTVAVEPGVTFAAHAATQGLVIDKMEGGQLGVLEPSSTPFSGPQFVLRSGDATTAALWVSGADIVVRSAADPTAPAIGRVDARWDARAIRLTLKPESDGSFTTSVFKRIAGGAGPAALGQASDSLLDLRGVYRADLVDGAGAPAGWLRVRFAHGWTAHRIYDGVLPDALNGALAIAAVARLDEELTAVSNTALNPYIGN